MDRGYGQGGPRQRDHPRTVPPYMGYPGGGRSYDDTYLRPQRGHKGGRRGPPQMELPYRRPMDHQMYNYYPPSGYDQMGYPYDMPQGYHGGPSDRRGYPQGPPPGEGMRYNSDPPQMNFRERGERPHMRPGQGGERGGRPSGPPDQREMGRGEGRGEPRGEPREPRGPRDYGNLPRDEDGRGPGQRGPGGPGGPPPRGPRQGGPGGPPMRDEFSHRPFQQDPSGPGPAGIRGGRGMRGSRGSGRGGSDRAEPNGHHGGPDHSEPMIRRNESRGGRGRGDGGPQGHGGPSDGPERRGGRGGDEAGKSHQIVTRTRGGRGGKEGGPAQSYN